MIAYCPRCKTPDRHPDEYVGKTVICSSCRKSFELSPYKEEDIHEENIETTNHKQERSQGYLFFGITFMFLGVVVIIVSLLMPITRETHGEEFYNIGLIHQRQTVLLIGCLVELMGGLFLGFGSICDAIADKR